MTIKCYFIWLIHFFLVLLQPQKPGWVPDDLFSGRLVTKLTQSMDDYHAENATSTCQKVFGAALLDGLDSRPQNC